jgi:hypothetical protein
MHDMLFRTPHVPLGQVNRDGLNAETHMDYLGQNLLRA